jgi:hypothetical protein|uniref:Uncharacterized protein n=1 Tax=Zea mays TaxID=4577 RepID=A0A804NIQ2_MAIZE
MKVDDGEGWSLASEMTSFDYTTFPRFVVEERDFNDNVFGNCCKGRWKGKGVAAGQGGSEALARDTKRKKETSSLKAKKTRVQIQVPMGTSSTSTNNFNTEAVDVVFAEELGTTYESPRSSLGDSASATAFAK